MGIMIFNWEKSSEDKDIETATLENDAAAQGTVINLDDSELQMTI